MDRLRRPRRAVPVLAALAVAALAGCGHAPVRSALAEWAPSPNFDARRPQLVVLHATEEPSAAQALRTLQTANAGGRVSAHYLIGRDGRIWQLVDERARAWHAGAGRWGGLVELNSASLGIELDNAGRAPYPPAQIAALLRLLDDITARWNIPRTQVIGHADLAPTRKTDPGAHFPWARLAAAGYGLWPQGELRDPPPGFDPWLALAAIGYPLDDRAATVRAFHRHYRGREDGDDPQPTLDAEDRRILAALARQRGAVP
ncbi:N-acetylmuramoyl-L-alanine amidase [Thermomonas flagellata]|uniref:N-acetylmuramoyl-L-alanine amidase n=1 Tax=Thermomonas flagellata TaxID=2888524 RepID=UPI001F044277|nr:N-acetylmuramoyl-L-alanine amidase [Thermomonas flagellata]